MTKILVTGASGFIGKNLIEHLRAHNFEIFEKNSLDGDLGDIHTWSNFNRAQILIHLAGNTFVPESWENPEKFMKSNLHGVICALEYCRKHNTRLIYLSSYLYGNPKYLPIPETAELIANNPYALSKKMAEEVCKHYANFFGIKITIFRPFNVYGKGQSEKFLIPSILHQINLGNVISVKDLKPKRDYIYIKDLTSLLIRAIDVPLDFETFNVGTGLSYSVGDLINRIQSIMGKTLEVKVTDEMRKAEIMHTQADIKKAFSVFGWTPKYSLNDGLKEMILNK
jgi:GDP-4-dehydro-6-deoxy-D-mannose reductase